ncbi:hypothetical protein CRUP_008073, partial [Coryphaenoides rupestris]
PLRGGGDQPGEGVPADPGLQHRHHHHGPPGGPGQPRGEAGRRPADRSVPPLLQPLRHPAVVPAPGHAAAHPHGALPGRAHRRVPLVCRPLPAALLPAAPRPGAGALTGRLACHGGRGRALPRRGRLRRHGERDAGAQPPPPARRAAELGVPAAVDALVEADGPVHRQVRDGVLRDRLLRGNARHPGGRRRRRHCRRRRGSSWRGSRCVLCQDGGPAGEEGGVGVRQPGLGVHGRDRPPGRSRVQAERTGALPQHAAL